MIELINVTKKFGKNEVIHNVSFKIPKGRIVALIGANGSGKTTLMRMISTIIEPTSGEIFVDGINVKKSSNECKKRIGLILGGDATLFKNFTARENIYYFARLQGMDDNSAKECINKISNLLNMNDYIDKRVDIFSRGMRQKVVLASALIHDPSILLMDEPSTGLDVFAIIDVQNIIKSCQNLNKTVLISSHNFNEIEKLCDYIIIIEAGRIIFANEASALKSLTSSYSVEEAFKKISGLK
ncbi:MAG: ABC transporter ATP-binding protein [Clostridia bacterium]|nr:ABC transporter ATP-binding protein [Clostridia bacterium]